MAVAQVVRLINSYKAQLAFFAPFICTVLGVVANWVVTGEFNMQEVRIAIGGLVTSIITAISVYFAKPGMAQVQVVPDTADDAVVGDNV